MMTADDYTLGHQTEDMPSHPCAAIGLHMLQVGGAGRVHLFLGRIAKERLDGTG